ncbi:hypothetical protein ScPMuIL_001009 [Solemya velum]
MDPEQYVCTLTEESVRKAAKELNEDPDQRAGALSTFIEWIQQQNWLHTSLDPKFLLAFLRSRKLSQLGARELLRKFWTMKTKIPQWHYGADPMHTKARELLETGVLLKLPGVDRQGQKMLLIRPGQLDPSGRSYSFDDWMRFNTLIVNSLLFDENVQVNGVLFLLDFNGLTLKHQSFIGIEESKNIFQTLQGAMPLRMKELHHYNTGPVFEVLFAIIRPLMTEKIRKRVRLHGNNLVSLYREIDMCLLPEEYLPDDHEGPSAGRIPEIIEQMIEELQQPSLCGFLQDLHSQKYGVDLRTMDKNSESQSSYRKLNVT